MNENFIFSLIMNSQDLIYNPNRGAAGWKRRRELSTVSLSNTAGSSYEDCLHQAQAHNGSKEVKVAANHI